MNNNIDIKKLVAIAGDESTKQGAYIGVDTVFFTTYGELYHKAKCEQAEAVTKLWESLGRWSAYLASNGEQAELSPPSWLIDAVKNATNPQQPQEQDELVKKAVADALEDVANSLYAQITWSDDSDDKTTIINETLLEATHQIRALIKRDAEGVE